MDCAFCWICISAIPTIVFAPNIWSNQCHLHWKSFASWQRSQNQIWPPQQGAARQKSRKNTLMHFHRQPEGAIWLQMHGTHFDWPGPIQNLIRMVQGKDKIGWKDWKDKHMLRFGLTAVYIDWPPQSPTILTSKASLIKPSSKDWQIATDCDSLYVRIKQACKAWKMLQPVQQLVIWRCRFIDYRAI